MSLAFKEAESAVRRLAKTARNAEEILRTINRLAIRQGEFEINQLAMGNLLFLRQEDLHAQEKPATKTKKSVPYIFDEETVHEFYLGTQVLPEKYITLEDSATARRITLLAKEVDMDAILNKDSKAIGLVKREDYVEAVIRRRAFYSGEGNAELHERIGKEIYGLTTSNVRTGLKNLRGIRTHYPSSVWEQVGSEPYKAEESKGEYVQTAVDPQSSERANFADAFKPPLDTLKFAFRYSKDVGRSLGRSIEETLDDI